jgi:hypothetical protein
MMGADVSKAPIFVGDSASVAANLSVDRTGVSEAAAQYPHRWSPGTLAAARTFGVTLSADEWVSHLDRVEKALEGIQPPKATTCFIFSSVELRRWLGSPRI